MATIATILIKIGGGGIGALQSFVVIAAIPVSILLFPVVWYAPKVAKVLAIEQGIVKEEKEIVEADAIDSEMEVKSQL